MSTAHADIAVAVVPEMAGATVASTPVTRVEILDLLDSTFTAGPVSRTALVGAARSLGARVELLDLLEHLPERQYTHQRELWVDLPHVPVGL